MAEKRRALPPRAARAAAQAKLLRPLEDDEVDALDQDVSQQQIKPAAPGRARVAPKALRAKRASNQGGGRATNNGRIVQDVQADTTAQQDALGPSNAASDRVFNDPGDMPSAIPTQVQLAGSPLFYTGRRLGKGGFGCVYLGWRDARSRGAGTGAAAAKTPLEVALKFEHKSSKGCEDGPPHEWRLYKRIGDDVPGLPKVYGRGELGDWYILVLERLGPSLWDVWNATGQRALDEQQVAAVAVEALALLKGLHERGYVHGDVKPENFLLGLPGGPAARRLHLVDLGLTARWRLEGRGSHAAYDQLPDEFRGTVRYASVHSHLGRTASRRDDLESLAYSLLFLLKGRLPWQGYQGDHKSFFVARKKMGLTPKQLCAPYSPAFEEFTEAALGLRFDEPPDYAALVALFAPLLARVERPWLDLGSSGGGHKQLVRPGLAGKRSKAGEAATGSTSGAQAKRTRLGLSASQWVTVYDKRPFMKQRYHHAVAAGKLVGIAEAGWRDGLFITGVAGSGSDLWTLVMDAGPRYTVQVFRYASASFLPKDWITKQWDAGYYITSVAGCDSRSSLVVMSRGTGYTQQSYKVADAYPAEWVRKKWREGMHVTAMATAGSQWAVVMSRHSGFQEQCVELDFQYPSEGIHRRWDAGFRITACAATPDQAAFVLSKGGEARCSMSPPLQGGGAAAEEDGGATQETLRTARFPAEAVRDKWGRHLYISCLAFGRTVA